MFRVGGARSGLDLYCQLAEVVGMSEIAIVRAVKDVQTPGFPDFEPILV